MHTPALVSVPCVRALGGGGRGRAHPNETMRGQMVLFLRPRLLHYHMYMRAHCQNKCAPNLHTHPLMLQGAHAASQGAEWRHTHRTLRFKSHPHRCTYRGRFTHFHGKPVSMGCHTFLQASGALAARNVEAASLTCCHRLFFIQQRTKETGLKSSDMDILDNN